MARWGDWLISKGRWVGREDPKPRTGRASQAHSRPIHVIIQLLEGSGCQLLLPLSLGSSLLLCGKISCHPLPCPLAPSTLQPALSHHWLCAWPYTGHWGPQSGHCGDRLGAEARQ